MTDGIFANVIVSIIVLVGVGSMFMFLWSAFHEWQYKDLIDKSAAEKPKNKVKSAIGLIIILWLIGILIYGGTD